MRALRTDTRSVCASLCRHLRRAPYIGPAPASAKAAKMLYVLFLAAVPVATAARAGSEAGTNPLAQVLKLIDELQAKIESDGEVQQKAFKEYFEWCDDTAKNTANEIKTGEASVEKLTAKISELASSIEVADTNIGKLAGEIATRMAELKKATGIREKEAADFSASEKELMGAVDALERAVGILEKQAKGGAALVQVDTGNMANLISAVSVMLDAAAFPAADQKKLSSFLQAQQGASEDSEEDDDMSGAPAAAAYKNKSGGIIEVLEDMKEKAESQLDDLCKAETTNRHNFDMLKQSLDDEIAADNKDMEQEKEDKSAAAEQKAGAEGELEVTAKELAANKKELEPRWLLLYYATYYYYYYLVISCIIVIITPSLFTISRRSSRRPSPPA